MDEPTPANGNSVKQKEYTREFWDAERRARRAFIESPLVPPTVLCLFLYLLSRQGHKEYSYPSIAMIAARFKVSRPTVLKWIRETRALLGDAIFQVRTGTASKGSKGKGRNHYICLDFGYWPVDVVERLEGDKPKRKPRKPSKMVQSIGKAGLPTKNGDVVNIFNHSVESMERVFTPEDLGTQYYPYDSNPQNRICASCGQFAKDGFGYSAIWVCDVDCQQDYYERFMDVPDF